METKNKKVTLNRRIAQFAFEKVNEVDERSGNDYKSYAKSLPSMILNNGLGNAIAFEYSKKSKDKNVGAHDLLLEHILEFSSRFLKIGINNDDPESFFDNLLKVDNQMYQYYTEQILLFLQWVRRFAEGKFVKEGD